MFSIVSWLADWLAGWLAAGFLKGRWTMAGCYLLEGGLKQRQWRTGATALKHGRRSGEVGGFQLYLKYMKRDPRTKNLFHAQLNIFVFRNNYLQS